MAGRLVSARASSLPCAFNWEVVVRLLIGQRSQSFWRPGTNVAKITSTLSVSHSLANPYSQQACQKAYHHLQSATSRYPNCGEGSKCVSIKDQISDVLRVVYPPCLGKPLSEAEREIISSFISHHCCLKHVWCNALELAQGKAMPAYVIGEAESQWVADSSSCLAFKEEKQHQ